MRATVSLVMLLVISASVSAGEPAPPRGWLGLRFHLEPAGAGRPAAFLFIESVVPGGPADRAGLRKQDVVIELDGKPVAFKTDLEALGFFGKLRVGQKVRAKVVRNHEKREIVMTTIAPGESARDAWNANMNRAGERPRPR